MSSARPVSPKLVGNDTKQEAIKQEATKPGPNDHSSIADGAKRADMSNYGPNTVVVHGGPDPTEWTADPYGRSVANPPVYHVSTVIFPTAESLRFAQQDWMFTTGLFYGRQGNPTTWALEEAFAAVEGAWKACAMASGVAAVNASLLAFLRSGDHVLVTDAVYGGTRRFCDNFLRRFGVETTYYVPTLGPESLSALMRENTKVVFLESPASLSFEVEDVDALASVAHEGKAKVIIDNTWGPMVFKPFEHGCDVSINAATKYIGGHSDLMMGLIGCTEEVYRDIKTSVAMLGAPPGSDDAYLALRGLRTLGVRLREHEKSGRVLAQWLENRPEVVRVMHPGLPSHPQHKLWKRQFSGATGLFGFQLKGGFSQKAVNAMMNGLKLFSIGGSFGGYESLILQSEINSVRSAGKWRYDDEYGETFRINTGLEDVTDLIQDLDNGFARLHANNK